MAKSAAPSAAADPIPRNSRHDDKATLDVMPRDEVVVMPEK
jgi:hypothetical protein